MSFSAFGQGGAGFNFAGKYLPALQKQNKPSFSPETPQQFLEEKRKLEKLGFSKEEVNEAVGRFAPSSSLTPGDQAVTSLMPSVQKQIEQNIFLSSPEGMKMQLEMAREDAREKAKQGLLFNTLAKLPESIASAFNPFGGPAGAAMYYQGMSAIPGIVSQTMANYPQIQVPGSSTQQFRYFN